MIREQSGTNLYTLAWHPTGEFAILGLAWMQIFENWSQRPQNFFLHRFFHEVDGVRTDFPSDAPYSVSRETFAPRELVGFNQTASQVFDRIQPNSVTVAISGCGALWAVCIHPRVTMDVSKCISNSFGSILMISAFYTGFWDQNLLYCRTRYSWVSTNLICLS